MKAGMSAGYTSAAVDDHFLLVKSGKTSDLRLRQFCLSPKSGGVADIVALRICASS
jgi:hypothetical protein